MYTIYELKIPAPLADAIRKLLDKCDDRELSAKYDREGQAELAKMEKFGKEEKDNILVIEKLGSSLEDLFQASRCQLSLKTVLMIIEQRFTPVQFLHRRSIIHSDIKPDNFIMGTGANEGQVCEIDLGLSKRYRHPKSFYHFPLVEYKSMTVTAR